MGDTFGEGDDNERPVHEVCVDDFYIGKYEVTQREWVAVMGYNRSKFKKGDRYPVDNVEPPDADAFVAKLSNRSGNRYRLPTEAEWEYAARSGGKEERYAGTSSRDGLGDYVWYDDNSARSTHPVGEKKPNGLGIHDMSGNVWEWCGDYYRNSYYGSSPKDNPKGPSDRPPSDARVLRGGSWKNFRKRVRAAHRGWDDPDYFPHETGIGFRVVFTPPN